MRSMIVALVAVLLVAAAPALAGGGDKGDWELGVYGGKGWLDDYGIFHPKDHMLYGARLGYFMTPRWSAELSAQKLSTETEFDILGLQDVDAHLTAFRLNALYNLGGPGKAFRPFLTVGVGKEKFDVEDFGESCDLGWNAGVGFRLFMSPHWNIRADGRYVSTSVGGEVDETQKNMELTLGLGWVIGGHKEEKEETHAEAAVVTPPPNGPPTVTCASDRPEILPGESVGIKAIASDPDGDPLTYQWSTTAGRVNGNGANVTLDFTGATPPASATVTCRVSDDHGHTASANTAVRLREPAAVAEAVSCIAGGFAANFAGISNIDKACLDDVAQRLSAEPRARVIIVGHADSHEKTAEIAERRAEAVKDYLVKDRSIDGSRITTRSSATPLDAGTDSAAQAHNRGVEVWFVPEGATAPN